MAEFGRVGVVKHLQFSINLPNGFDRLTGVAASEFTVELWRDDGAGGRALVEPSGVTVAELDVDAGEYSASFTPAVERDHYVVVRHAPTFSDWAETINVEPERSTDARLDDILLLLGGGVTGLPS